MHSFVLRGQQHCEVLFCTTSFQVGFKLENLFQLCPLLYVIRPSLMGWLKHRNLSLSLGSMNLLR